MNVLPEWLNAACDRLRSRSDEPWDADDWMGDQHLSTTPTGELVSAFMKNGGPTCETQLIWLMMFATRRALACWQLYCDTTQPIDTVDAVRDWLVTDQWHDWSRFATPAEPSNRGIRIVDCRECDTGCVARAASEVARFIDERHPTLAICSLSAAEMAFDQSPLGSVRNYHHWFIDVAIPGAYARRELTPDEQCAFQDYNINDVSGDSSPNAKQ